MRWRPAAENSDFTEVETAGRRGPKSRRFSVGSPTLSCLQLGDAFGPKNEPARAGGSTRHGQHIIDEVRCSSA